MAAALVRVRLSEGRIGKAGADLPSGRGAWLHPREACVTQAVRTRAFGRSFRTAVRDVDPKELFATVFAERAFQ